METYNGLAIFIDNTVALNQYKVESDCLGAVISIRMSKETFEKFKQNINKSKQILAIYKNIWYYILN